MALTQATECLAGFIAILALDFKGDFVDVADRLGRDIWDHYSASDGLRLGCGPPLECINRPSWLSHFTKIIAAHCDLKYSESVLASVMRIALALLNTTGQLVTWPSLLLIEQLLDILPTEMISRKGDYKRPVQQKIEYLRRISGHLFDAEQGFDIFEHLIKPCRCAVINCTMLSALETQILVNLLALQFLFVQITLRRVSKETIFFLLVDESDPVCSREASIVYPEGYSYLAQYLKQARQFGGMGGLGVNFLGQCSRFITANTSYHIILNQSDPDSAVEGARTLLEPSARHLVSALPAGHGVFKEAMGPVPYGMLVRLDHVPASESGRPDQFDTHPFTPARGIDAIPGFRERLDAFIGDHRTSMQRQRLHAAKPLLTKAERTVLDHMSLTAPEPLDIIFSRTDGMTAGTQKRLLDGLAQKGMIQVETMRTGRSWTRFGLITAEGWQHLGKTSPYPRLRGGPTHTTVAYCKQRFDKKQGCTESWCEHQLPGSTGFHDVVSIKDGKYYVTEVVIGCDTNLAHHARDCLINSKVPVETLTIVSLLKSEHPKLRDMILSEPDLVFHIHRVSFLAVEDILKELYR